MILQSHASDADGWLLIAAPGRLLALPAMDAARLGALGERLGGEDGFRAALELLIAGGIAQAPGFALIDGNTAVARVVLRGETSAVVTAADPDAAELTISGVGVSTWSERVLEGARSLRLRVPGSTWTVRLEDERAAAARAAPVAEVTLVPRAEVVDLPAAAPQPAAPEPILSADPEPYDFLFGDTIYRTQSGASIRIPNPDPERPGDHDGRTMLAEQLGLRGHTPSTAAFPELPGAPVAPEARGLAESSASASASEWTVVAPIPGHVAAASPAREVPPPTHPTLQLEAVDGTRESLSQAVLIGRAPSAPSAASGPPPRLITILDDKDISRSHVRVAVEGDAVVVTDLASRNGTVITLPGGSPRKLRGWEPTVVLPGTLIDLGGGVAFTVRED